MRNRWLGPVLALVGVLLVVFGGVNFARLLAAPLEAQPGYLPQTVFPLLVGLALVVGGIHAWMARRNGQ